MPRRRVFVWIVPLLWGLVMIGATRHPGDEYFLYAVAALPALPLLLLVDGDSAVRALGYLGAAWACGLPVMALIGWGMDRVRAKASHFAACWLIPAALMACATVLDHRSLAAAISKNGSLWAYGFAALGFMAPLAAVVAMITALVRAAGTGRLDAPRPADGT